MRRSFLAFALIFISAVPAWAQDELLRSCVGQADALTGVPASIKGQYGFMCAQVTNAFTNVQPSVGIAFSGGNPVLGTGTTIGTRLGLIPRVSVTARANVAFADVPDVLKYSASISDEGRLGPMDKLGVPVASVQGDVAIGLFNGLSLGPLVSGLGSVDLLGSVAILPEISDVGLGAAVTNLGIGARVGILRQGILMPGLSVSGMYRRMSDVSFGDVAAGDPAQISANLETLSLRAVMSKGLLAFDFAVGAGYDRYTSDLGLDWIMIYESGGESIPLNGRIDGELTTAAWNVFGDVALNLLFLNLVGEIGYQKATDVLDTEDLRNAGLPTDQKLTTDELKGGRFFGSIGLRISI